MARARPAMNHALLPYTAFVLYSAFALAQDDSPTIIRPGPTTAPEDPPEPTEDPGNDEDEDNEDNEDNEDDNEDEDEDDDEAPTPTSDGPVIITPTGDSGDADDTPVITGGPTQTGGGGLTTGPTLTGAPLVIDYPPPAVPDTFDAPFMQRSSAPDGTVFIAVGAILGAFGLAILLWRAIVAYLLHRSVERAAAAQQLGTDKTALFAAPPAPFFADKRDGSPAAGLGARRTNRGPTPSATPSMSNLYFSPTAQSTTNVPGAGAMSRPDSRFLPSGFYAANAAAGAAPQGSSSNLRPDSRHANGSRHTLNPSPPDSPRFPIPRDMSSSSLGNRPGSIRAPSAYLEEMFDEPPQTFQAPSMPANRASHARTPSYGSNYGQHRY